MAFSTDILSERITVLNRTEGTEGAYGRKAGEYQPVKDIWADWHFTRGARAQHEGAIDAYDTILVRTRYHDCITRDSRLRRNGRDYQITSLNDNRRANEMQIVCTEVVK